MNLPNMLKERRQIPEYTSDSIPVKFQTSKESKSEQLKTVSTSAWGHGGEREGTGASFLGR
jgi:hypothetical protein